MTRNAAVGFDGSVFVNKRTLLVCVTLDASCVGAGGESGLLEFKPAMRIVAIAALHRALKHLMMERQIKLVLGLAVTTEAKLRFAVAEQLQI